MIQDENKVENQPQIYSHYGLDSYKLLHSCKYLIINELVIRIMDKSNYSIEYK